MPLKIVPCSLRKANDFIEAFHRHSLRTARDGGKFAIAAADAWKVPYLGILFRVGERRPFAFVNVGTREEGLATIALLNLKMLQGSRIVVREAKLSR